jgi:ATP-dependent helicase/nuclease subunit A
MSTPLSIVKASAGSGKTHYLSGHILRLLCQGERSSKIFASTFTRKAAGEMFERVVQRLIRATENDESRERLMEQLSLPPDALSGEQLTTVLESFIREQSQSKISTLDSFFVSIAQAFFTELYLPGAWKIADPWEISEIEEAALERSFSNLGKDPLQSILGLLDNRKHSSMVRTLLLQEMRSIHETFNSSSPLVWGKLAHEEAPQQTPDLTYLQSLLDMEHPVLVDGIQVHKSTLTTAKKFLTWFEEKKWDEILASKLTESICVTKECMYYKKPVPPRICEGVELLYAHARSSLLKELQDRTLALAAIASEYTTHIIRVSLEKGLLGFRELTRALGEGLHRIALQDIYYRLDSQISHILIDEFQDTAPLQWSILEPLVSEIISGANQEHSFLTVGDVKQAIYSWRGGTSELFDVLTSTYPQLRDHEHTLTTTYRSFPGIVTLVNSIFLDLPENPALSGQEQAVLQWSKDFHAHSAFKKGSYGKIRIASLSLPERDNGRYLKEEIHAAACRELLEDITPFLHAPEISTVGILVRRNAEVNLLESFFSEHGYQVSGEGGEPLAHSRTIQLLTSALTFAQHPGDIFCVQHILDSPLRNWIHSLCDISDTETSPSPLQVHRALSKHYTTLGPEAFLRCLIHELRPCISASDYDRCLYSLTLALGFERAGGTNPDELVRIITQSSIESASASKIRIMTFHKSKGLEFDAVFIPFTDVPFYSARNIRLLKKQESSLSPPDSIVLSPKKKSLEHFPELREMYQDATKNQTVEGLSTMYVALTRAVHSLFVYLPPLPARRNSDATSIQTPGMASVLRGAFGYHDELPPGRTLYSHDGPFPAQDISQEPLPETIPAPEKKTVPPYTIPEFAALKNLHRTYPSEREHSAVLKIRETLDRSSTQGTDFGTRIHAALKNISWITTSFEALRLDIQEDELRYLSAAFSHRSIQQVFDYRSFSDTPDTIHLEREIPFSLIHSGAILSGRLDRLVLLKKNNQFEHACIIDFKTGTDADEMLLTSQSKAYSLFVEKKYGIPGSGIVTRFVFLSSGKIIERRA